ncbi:DUF547 domain-containing protein [Lewinella sp. 4G2]|uniref:DUF547 domain-containing protein n=1 Tax=Lewinella sp. 4G2 TaxID=1803372 RepID=UPI0009EF3885|nr:DUF547 domain-containing protein [Lewinella sp. 4G2]
MLRCSSLLTFALALLFSSCGSYQPTETYPPTDPDFVSPNQLSEELLQGLKDGEDVSALVTDLADLNPKLLAAALDTREKQLSFWVNTYNAMVQHLLTEDPSLFDNRGDFFSTPAFTVAGKTMSPNEMEHGIIRGGENRFGLGFIPQIFSNKFERTFAIDGGDSRVHFALNCGAADCPPVEIYEPETFQDQINERVTKYLAKHSEIKEVDGEKTIYLTPLFSWFRGDFKDRGGIADYLVEYGVLTEEQKDINREFKDYDWTLKTGIWAED